MHPRLNFVRREARLQLFDPEVGEQERGDMAVAFDTRFEEWDPDFLLPLLALLAPRKQRQTGVEVLEFDPPHVAVTYLSIRGLKIEKYIV